MKLLTLTILLLGAAVVLMAQTGAETVALEEYAEVVGEPAGSPLSGEAARIEAERVSSLIRCPVCQGLSLADSPSPMAQRMRELVAEMTEAGYSETQILLYFETSYGEFVLLDPPARGINWVVWLTPVALLIGGIAWLVRMRTGESPASSFPVETEPVEETDPYLVRARALGEGETDG